MARLRPIVKKFYGNVKMEAPDGSVLAHIDNKRARWYVERGLADVVSPKVIRLKFEPGGEPTAFESKHLFRENKCVVCGETVDLTKHHLVPRVYRRHFPAVYKDRNHYDVVMLCIECHERYEDHAKALKKAITEEVGLTPEQVSPEAVRLRKLRGFARALRDHGDKMPPERREALRQSFESLRRQEEGDYGFFANLKIPGPDPSERFAIKVVEGQPSIPDFIIRWRRDFLSTMYPKFMPPDWSETYIKKCRPSKFGAVAFGKRKLADGK